MDYEHLNKWHTSMFDPIKANVSDDTMEQVFEIYRRLKCDGTDRKSADPLIMIVPGPPPNNHENKNVAAVLRQLKKTSMTAPKVGRIEFAQADVLRRIKSKFSFAGHFLNILF